MASNLKSIMGSGGPTVPIIPCKDTVHSQLLEMMSKRGAYLHAFSSGLHGEMMHLCTGFQLISSKFRAALLKSRSCMC